MALYPNIQSPCPYKGNLTAIMDGDTCRMCKRQVFDLSAMNDGERVAFLKGCSAEVCVTYKFPVRPVLAAAAIAVASIAMPTAVAACPDIDTVIVTGGIKDPANVQYIKDTSDNGVAAIPVVYENDKAAPAAATQDNAGNNTIPMPAGSPAGSAAP